MKRLLALGALVLVVFGCTNQISAQSISSGTVTGTVKDPSGAVVPKATVEIRNPVTGYQQTTTSDTAGKFRFNNVPFNGYSLTAALSGFNPVPQNVNIRSTLPVDVTLALALAGASTTVTVEAAGAAIENVPGAHTDVDLSTLSKLPIYDAGRGIE